MVALNEMEYDLEGYYSLDGQRGAQKGLLTLCGDGKIIGSIWDDNSGGGNHSDKKFLLGIRNLKEHTLSFLKISPGTRARTDLIPIIWHLDLVSEERGIETYQGAWADASYVIGTEEMERLVLGQGIEDQISRAKQLPFELLKESYFNPEQMPRLKLDGERYGQTGGVVLTPRT